MGWYMGYFCSFMWHLWGVTCKHAVKPTINGDQQLAGSGFFPFCGLVQTLRIYPKIAIPMGNAMIKTSHHFQTNPRGCTIKIIGFFNHLPSAEGRADAVLRCSGTRKHFETREDPSGLHGHCVAWRNLLGAERDMSLVVKIIYFLMLLKKHFKGVFFVDFLKQWGSTDCILMPLPDGFRFLEGRFCWNPSGFVPFECGWRIDDLTREGAAKVISPETIVV